MKYFRVKNDILKSDDNGNPSWTDEPEWLRNEIDQWKERYGEDIGGGRFFATQNALYSYIISPNEDLMDLAEDDLEELTENEIVDVIAIAFPPQVISREGEPDEIIPSPSLETVCNTYWHYATNHTGTISANESWTVANNDHHITGNITINANIVVTWDAGINVYYDGNYSITRTAGSGGNTTITGIGTAALPITIEANQSRTGTAQYNTISTGITGANNCVTTLQYCNIANFNTFLVASSYTSFTTTLDHLSIRDCNSFIANAGASTVPTISISNSRFVRCNAAAVGFGTVTSGSSTHTFTDCEWRGCGQVVTGTQSGGTVTVNYVDCAFLDRTVMSPASGNNLSILTHNFTRCLIDCTYVAWTTAVPTFTDTIFTRSTLANGIVANTGATGNVTFTNCDIMMSGTGALTTQYAVSNLSTAATTITLSACYISAFRGADIYNYYTGSETPAQTQTSGGGIISFSSARTTRNFPFTQTSITESSIDSSSATVSWTGAFRTNHRLAIGTVSGTYTKVYTKDDSWTDFDGKGKMTASPSFTVTGLSAATTYYYVCESWDWVRQMWVKSTEGDFTTTGSAPTFAGITGLENVGFGALLVSWAAGSGSITSYNIYIKIGSAPVFTEKPIKVDSTLTSFVITHLSDGTRLNDSNNVYVSVRATNAVGEETNSAVLNLYPVGSGSTGVIVGDTVALTMK